MMMIDYAGLLKAIDALELHLDCSNGAEAANKQINGD